MTQPLPTTGGDYEIRNGQLVPAAPPLPAPAPPEAPATDLPTTDSTSARKRRSALITDEE